MSMSPKLPSRLKIAALNVSISITLGGLVGCGGSSDNNTVVTSSPPLVTASADDTASKTMGWLSEVGKALFDFAKGAAAIAEGHVVAGSFEFAAGGFALIGKGLEPGEEGGEQAKQLTEIDTKLDTLIESVKGITDQVQTVQTTIDEFYTSYKLETTLGIPMASAKTWLDKYYTDQTRDKKSREWARWQLAGCDTSWATCPSDKNPVSKERLKDFRARNVKNATATLPKELSEPSDNFPLWWSYSVVGDLGLPGYNDGGFTADALVDKLFNGLTQPTLSGEYALESYMKFQMDKNKATCVSEQMDKCDLFNSVYMPLESYFSHVIGQQSQLVSALMEAKTMLAQKRPDAFLHDPKLLMADYNSKLNEEVEIFLRVAEQIALYRAADGRSDWSNFGELDAGKLLARADFVAMKLAGANYRTDKTNPPLADGYVNPPWPSSGVVGRIFYADQEPIPRYGHAVCVTPCASFLMSWTDNSSSSRVVSDARPYLTWSDPAYGSATATARTKWTVQRLTPISPPALAPTADDYDVLSTFGGRVAKLAVKRYGTDFVSTEAQASESIIPFGSFSSVEGNIGRYGFSSVSGQWVTAYGQNNLLHRVTSFSSNSPALPGGPSVMSVDFLANPNWSKNHDSWPISAGNTKSTWSAEINVVLRDANAEKLDPEKYALKVDWASDIDIQLDSQTHSYTPAFMKDCGPLTYYSYVSLKQSLLNNKGKSIAGGTAENSKCNSDPFKTCNTSKQQAVGVTTPAADLTFNAKFTSEVDPYNTCDGPKYASILSSKGKSYASWSLHPPVLVLIKK